VRFVYLDESGISANERIALVAGAIVNADHQWKVLQEYVDGLIEEYVPHERRRGFVFHATHLFHGSGPVFDRRIYPQERRWEALKKLIGIPAKFLVPIAYGYHTKSAIPLDQQQPTAHKRARMEQVLAFSLCAIAAERFMREKATPNEVATLVAENNNEVKRAMKAVHHLLGTPEAITVLQPEAVQAYLPLRRIVDTIHFAEKNESILLQIADACALFIRYFLEGRKGIDQFLSALTGNNSSILVPPDEPAGYRALYFFNPSKVSSGETWLVSSGMRSSTG
jgi:hypothetical protein